MAFDAVRFFRHWNGGIHRGGIPGDNEVRLPVLSDEQVLDLEDGRIDPVPEEDEERFEVDTELLARANLFLVGNPTSNAVLARLATEVPLAVDDKSLTVGGKKYRGTDQACLAVFPHPDHQRYVAVLAGQNADAICWGSHVGLQLTPDFLVFERERVVDWGFWNNQWRSGSP